jgi:hypothetical protein
MDFISLAQDTDQWRTLLNEVVNVQDMRFLQRLF